MAAGLTSLGTKDNLCVMDSWPSAGVPRLPGRAPEVRVWDTATRDLQVAAPSRLATLYACGITPYDATHIGHASTYIAWDLLVRVWRDAGHEVRYAQNVTDVDDPLLERAVRDGQDWRELADRETDRYRADMAALRVLPPDHLIGAVEALDLIEDFSGELADRGALYEVEGDVYLSRSADPRFGEVSGLDPRAMIRLAAVRGGDPDRPGKKDPLDPLVWRSRRPGEPFWESRFGQGRPGWHVECTAIATRYLGRTFDVQAGGADLMFPHHEMSASHARVAFAEESGPLFARRYCHAGMVRLGGEKMSKSLGNLVFVSVLRESGIDPMVIRLAILANHYRQGWEWTEEGLREAAERLARWRAAVRFGLHGETKPGLPVLGGAGPGGAASDSAGVGQVVLSAIRERLADDLDAPGAIAAVDSWADATLGDAGEAAGQQPGAGLSDRSGPDRSDNLRPESAGATARGAARLVSDAVDALLGVRI